MNARNDEECVDFASLDADNRECSLDSCRFNEMSLEQEIKDREQSRLFREKIFGFVLKSVVIMYFFFLLLSIIVLLAVNKEEWFLSELALFFSFPTALLYGLISFSFRKDNKS